MIVTQFHPPLPDSVHNVTHRCYHQPKWRRPIRDWDLGIGDGASVAITRMSEIAFTTAPAVTVEKFDELMEDL
jgi:hypothetical protein